MCAATTKMWVDHRMIVVFVILVLILSGIYFNLKNTQEPDVPYTRENTPSLMMIGLETPTKVIEESYATQWMRKRCPDDTYTLDTT